MDEKQKSLPATLHFPVTATFAYQDEKWVLKSAVVTDDGFAAGNGFFKSGFTQPTDSETVNVVRHRLRESRQRFAADS